VLLDLTWEILEFVISHQNSTSSCFLRRLKSESWNKLSFGCEKKRFQFWQQMKISWRKNPHPFCKRKGVKIRISHKKVKLSNFSSPFLFGFKVMQKPTIVLTLFKIEIFVGCWQLQLDRLDGFTLNDTIHQEGYSHHMYLTHTQQIEN